MRGKGNQNHLEEEEYDEEELVVGSRKDGGGGGGGAPSSNVSATTSNSANNTNSNRDGKNSDKASAVRSKHSVTEQRRRSKINERFQILRELIPQCDQKRDTASFLLEVIEYVRYLQEKVQKYEGPYQGWPADPTKSMPWRNSHWQVQNLVGHPQALSNGSGMGPVFPAKLDDNGIAVTSSMIASAQNVMDPDSLKDAAMMQQADLLNKDGYPDLLRHFQTASVPALHSDGINAHHHPLQQPLSNPQSAECPMTADILHQQEELAIEGGTINISSAYSEGLLNALTQALQTAGVDVSQANISLQIDLGKRAKDQTAVHPRDGTGAGESDHVHKRMKM